MRYSTELRFRKYVKGYGFLSFAGKFGDKMQQKLLLNELFKKLQKLQEN